MTSIKAEMDWNEVKYMETFTQLSRDDGHAVRLLSVSSS